MASNENEQGRDVRPFQCRVCPNGRICLRWRRTVLLHFNREDVPQILECLEDILKQPSASFCLGPSSVCACRAADGFCYLVCQDRVVLRLSDADAQSLQSTLAPFSRALEPQTGL